MSLFRRKKGIEEIDKGQIVELRTVEKPPKPPLPTWAKIVIAFLVIYLILAIFTPTNPLGIAKYYFFKFLEWMNTYQTITFRRWVWIAGTFLFFWVAARFFYLIMPTLYLVDENKFITVMHTKESKGHFIFFVFEWMDWPPRPRLEKFVVDKEFVVYYYKMYVIRHPKGKKLLRVINGRQVTFDTEDREAVWVDLLEKELMMKEDEIKYLRERVLRLERQLGAIPVWEQKSE